MSAIQQKIEQARAMLEARRAGKAADAPKQPNPEAKTAEVIQIQPDAPSAPITAAAQLAEVKQTADKDRPDAAARTAALINEVAVQFEPFMDQYGEVSILHVVGGRVEAVPIKSPLFSECVFEKTGRHLSRDNLEAARVVLRVAARKRDTRMVYKRVGLDGSYYTLDLGDKDGVIIRSDGNGWTMEINQGLAFRRPPGYGELPKPVHIESAEDAWEAVQPLLEGLAKHNHVPLIAAMVEAMKCDSPYPIIVFIGSEGSGKSSKAARVKQTLDSFNGPPPSANFELRDMVAAVNNTFMPLFDNVQAGLGKGVQDLLCRMSVGGAHTTRELNTTADTATINVHAPVVVTAIANPFNQPDVQDRCLFIPVQKPKSYQPGAVVHEAYQAALPRVLGGLLYFLVASIRRRQEVAAQRQYKHRLVEWLMTGEAIMQELGRQPGEFVAMIDARRQRAAEDYIEGDAFAHALVKTLRAWGATAKPADKMPGWRSWSKQGWCAVESRGRVLVVATAQAICAEAKKHCEYSDLLKLPATARATTGALQRVQGVLGRAGIESELKPVNGDKSQGWFFCLPRTFADET